MQSALITGGAGFLGAHLARALAGAGVCVVLVDNFADLPYSADIKRRRVADVLADVPKIILVEADVADEAALQKIFQQHGPFCAVFHLAALAGVRAAEGREAEYVCANIVGTAAALQEAARAGVPRFVFSSSSSVYGSAQPPFAEHLRPRPRGVYGATKLAAEAMCRSMASRFESVTALRLFTVYGPHGRPDTAPFGFAQRIASGRPITLLGNGSATRQFLHIDDAVSALRAAALRSKGERFEIINIAGPRSLSVRQLIELLEKNLGRRAVIRQQSAHPKDVPNARANTARARELLGFSASITPQTGIADMCQQLQEQITDNR